MKHTGKTLAALAKLAASLPSTSDILRGSLLQRRIRHRSGCAVCARGEGHLISVLTVSYPGGRTKQISHKSQARRSLSLNSARLSKTGFSTTLGARADDLLEHRKRMF